MTKVWRESGFAEFTNGEFGNSGHNLYVSRAGVLQRIFQYDLNGNGFLDLFFCNSQNHWERPPAYVYRNCLSQPTCCHHLPAEGAVSAAIGDLNGNGYDDLVIANLYNGICLELSATIYYGTAEGWTERYTQYLPAPESTSVAVGDFNGDGRLDIAILTRGKVRIFPQSELGFEPKRYRDTDIEGQQIRAHDLDGDGRAELVVRASDGIVKVYWGDKLGLDPARFAEVPAPADPVKQRSSTEEECYTEYVAPPPPQVPVILLRQVPHIFVARKDAAYLVPVVAGRQFGDALRFDCQGAISIDVGNISGGNTEDLAIVCCQQRNEQGQSWIYWDENSSYRQDRRTPIDTFHACDVVVAELGGSGCDDVVVCQDHDGNSFDTCSLIYRGGRNGVTEPPIQLPSHDARRVLVGRSSDRTDLDLVVINHFSRSFIGDIDNAIYYGGPEGFDPKRSQRLPGWGSAEGICVDLNDDGRSDLIFCNASENSVNRDPGSYVFINRRDGFESSPTFTLPTRRAHCVTCADINRDGYLDLMFTGFDNPELVIFYGGAEGWGVDRSTVIRMEHDGVLYKEPRFIYLADLNNDGHLDLVVPQIKSDRSFVLWGSTEGFSMERCQFLSVFHACSVRAADLTGNGFLDLLVGGHTTSTQGPHDSFVYIYWNGPEGLSEARRTLLPADGVNSMALGDFNNDGRLDLFVGSYSDVKWRDLDSFIYWNREGRYFCSTDRQRLFTHSASGSIAADFNEDGYVDLAVANHKVWGDHVGYSEVWWNSVEGFDPNRTTRLPTSGPHGMTSVEPGNIMDRGPEEYYVSSAHELPDGATVRKIQWEADIPEKTWVKAQLRFAPSKQQLPDATWQGPGGLDGWFENEQAAGTLKQTSRWTQYRLALGAINGGRSPRVKAVEVTYE